MKKTMYLLLFLVLFSLEGTCQHIELKPLFYTNNGTKLLSECSCDELRKNPDLQIKFKINPAILNFDKVNFIVNLNLKGNGTDDDDFLNYFEYRASYSKNDMQLHFKNKEEVIFVLLDPNQPKKDFEGNMVLAWNPAPKYNLLAEEPINLTHICGKSKKNKIAMSAWLKTASITSTHPQTKYSWKMVGESDLFLISIK